MARRTNYAFERKQRAQAKTAKREAKRQAKLAARADAKDKTVDEAKSSVRGTGSADKVPANDD